MRDPRDSRHAIQARGYQSKRKHMELRKEGITPKTIRRKIANLIVATVFLSFIIFALISTVLPYWVGALAAVAVALLNVVPAGRKIAKRRKEIKQLEDHAKFLVSQRD